MTTNTGKRVDSVAEISESLSPEQMRQMLRELGARLIQFEAQNEELRAAQKHFGATSILESISDAFFSMDDDMVVTYFNHAAEVALGRRSEEVLGRRLFEAFPEARGSIFEEQYTRALEEKTQVSFETYFGISPYENWYDVRVYPNPEGISVFFQLITERKQVLERLEAAHAKLEALWGISSLADATVKVVSDHILASITRMTRSEYGFYGFVNEDESVMTIHAWSGEAMSDCAMVDKPSVFPVCSAGVWGEAIRGRKPLILNEYSAAHQGKKGLPEGHVALSRLLVVPFFSHGRITALAAVANRTADYGQDDVDEITAFLTSVQAIADSKRAEAALRESEEKHRMLVQNLNAGVVVHAPDTRILLANEQASVLLGLTVDQMMGKTAMDPAWRFIREDRSVMPLDEYPVNQVISKQAEVTHFVVGICRPVTNDVAWVMVNAFPEFAGDGTLHQVVVTFVDITGLKSAEIELHSKESFLRMIYERTQAAIFVVDVCEDGDFRYVDWNNTTEAVTGITSEQAKGRSPEELFGPVYGKAVRDNYRRCVREGSCLFEESFDMGAGTSWWQTSIALIANRDGYPYQILGVASNITERKQVEEALQSSLSTIVQREKEKSMLLAVSRAVMECDTFEASARRIFDLAREATGAVSGYVALLSPEGQENEVLFLEAGGMPCDVDPSLPMPIRGLRAEAYATGKTVYENDFANSEWIRFMPPGHVFLRNVMFAPLVIDGKVAGVIGLANKPGDFSEDDARIAGAFGDLAAVALRRAHAEEALRKSEEQLRSAQAMAHMGNFSYSFRTDTVTWSDEVYRLFGIEPVGRPLKLEDVDRMIHPDDLDHWRSSTQRSIDAGGTVSTEYRIVRPDGGIRHHYVMSRVSLSPDGHPLEIVGTVQDVTDLKQADEELRLLTDTITASLNEIYIFDADSFRFRFVNEGALRNLGYTAEEIRELTPLDLKPGFTDESFRELVRPLRQGEIAVRVFETQHRRADGSLYPVEVHLQLMGQHHVFLAVMDDITDRKKAEEERAKLESQLHQAQKMESVGRLAGGVAHDFNNMLQVILGNVDLAMDGVPAESPMRESLGQIRSSAERSAGLARQLLAFARKQTIAPRVLDLNETVTGMLKMLQRLIGENIDLEWQPGADLWAINVDPSQIDQILANLCVNARDAIADVGKISIETGNSVFDEDYCAKHSDFAPGEYVRLAVSDSGCGMDAETLAHIFEPFFTTKGVGQGTGLGLAMVYGAVKQNNGFINAYSEPGHGTTFTIYLPRHVGKAEQMRTDGEAEPNARGHETILLVEDEPSILKLTARLLQKHGYTVLSAVTPGDAIRLAREYAGEIHLLMTDVIMPEMNGRDVARNVQSLYPNIKRLFMSGYMDDIIASQGVLDKGVNFIQKPFSTQSLAAKIREALDSE